MTAQDQCAVAVCERLVNQVEAAENSRRAKNLLSGDMGRQQQIGEIAGAASKNLLRGAFDRSSGLRFAKHLRQIRFHVCPVGGTDAEEEIAESVGNPVPRRLGNRERDLRAEYGAENRKRVPEFLRLLT